MCPGRMPKSSLSRLRADLKVGPQDLKVLTDDLRSMGGEVVPPSAGMVLGMFRPGLPEPLYLRHLLSQRSCRWRREHGVYGVERDAGLFDVDRQGCGLG